MITKAKSLNSSYLESAKESNQIFQVPQVVKLSNLTPKKHMSEYPQIINHALPNKEISRYAYSSGSKFRATSAGGFDSKSSISAQGSQKVHQFTNFLKNYVKIKNSSLTPIVQYKKIFHSSEDSAKKQKNPAATRALPGSRSKTKPIKRTRPARFLSQEDIENHIKAPKEKSSRYSHIEGDLKILMENNHKLLMKSFEADKICRMYHNSLRKPSIIKNREWTWESPSSSPRYVQFKEDIN